MATLGYGAVTPVRRPVTTLTWMEAVFGKFRVAVMVAQLVGLKLANAIIPAKQEEHAAAYRA